MLETNIVVVLFCVLVFSVRHPAPDGEQAVHHESRGVCLRHTQHLSGYHLHLLLFPPNLWNKTRLRTPPPLAGLQNENAPG